MGVIIGAAGGGGAVLLLIVALLFYRARSKKKASFASITPAPSPAAPLKGSSQGKSGGTGCGSSSTGGGSLSLSAGASASAQARMSKAQEFLRAFEVDASEITTHEKLGEGGQAVVVRGVWNGIEVAIKQPRVPTGASRGKKDTFGSSSAMDSFNQAVRREVRALSRVRHPNVIRLHGACFDPAPMVLMDYAPSGTLQDALDAHMFQVPSEMVRLLAGIARGMEAVHAHKIVHLDLKPENVLIGPLNTPWITDFGLSTSANMASMSTSSAGGRGTLPFKAPELFAHPPHVGPEADVYAYAILAWVVVCGEQPYTAMQAAATSLPQAVMQGVRPTLADPHEEWKDKATAPMVRLIEACWHAEYAQRPVFGSRAGDDSGGPGEEAKNIVAMLEKMEHSLAKGSEAEASQLYMATRLISAEAEAWSIGRSLVHIDAAREDGETTAMERNDLAEERHAMETSRGLLRQNAFAVKCQMPGGADGELTSAVCAMLSQQQSMFLEAMRELQGEVSEKFGSVERSLSRLAEGELECPRLFVLLPMEASSSRLTQLVRREFVKDKYRLVFLDPVTGCAAKCGSDGLGYKLELPKKWLVENRKIIGTGLKVVKLCAAAGRLAGLPLPSAEGLPSQALSKAEVEAVKTFEAVYEGSGDLVPDAGKSNKAAKAATGAAYKQLRKLLKEQCKDEYLVHCEMAKEKANDGSIEFVSAASKERFVQFGQHCLIWNDEALKKKATTAAAMLNTPEDGTAGGKAGGLAPSAAPPGGAVARVGIDGAIYEAVEEIVGKEVGEEGQTPRVEHEL